MKDLSQINKFLQTENISSFRAKQLLEAVYKKGILEYDLISTLPKRIKQKLENYLPISSISLVEERHSKDNNTQKFSFKLNSGELIETVLMKYEDGRNSVCISCQAGCQMGCKFCATGALGFLKNLSAEEITDQVLFVLSRLLQNNQTVSNVVFMGMGEPFLNYIEVIKAIGILTGQEYFHLSSRRITVSTCGIVEGIEKFTHEDFQVNLALSLHAPTQALREKIMPVAKMYPLDQLLESIKNYCDITNRRVSFEYVLLNNVNDSTECAEQLARIAHNKLIHINLIPYNNTSINDIKGTSREKFLEFQKILQKRGVNVTVRVSMGQEILAACGQLANKAQQFK